MNSRYERINRDDDEDRDQNGVIRRDDQPQMPASPPPSFHSIESRPTTPTNDANLMDAFIVEDDEDEENDDRRGRDSASRNYSESIPLVAPTQPSTTSSNVAPSGRIIGGGGSNDGVFANLSAKPSVNEPKLEEHPPTYEQAAADATPPYWETTIMAPGMTSDEVFIDGLPVGSGFAFIWNMMVSMSFQFIGFLLTYLLHTTHAAKNGSRAGLGITLVQYGFYIRAQPSDSNVGTTPPPAESEPNQPNNHNWSGSQDGSTQPDNPVHTMWLSYALILLGWIILIKSVTDFFKARRTEAVVLASPDRGLGVAVVAEDETPERAV